MLTLATSAAPGLVLGLLASLPGQALPVAIKPVHEISVRGGVVHGVDLDPTGRLLVSGGELGDLQLRRYPGLEPVWSRTASDHWFGDVRFSRDGRHVAAAGRGVSVWTVDGGRRVFQLGDTGPCGVAWSPDGSSLAFRSAAGITLVSTRTWRVTGTLGPGGDGEERPYFERFAWRPDGRALIAGDGGGGVWSIDPVTGMRRLLHRHGEASVQFVGFTAGRLVSAGWTGELRIGAKRAQHGKTLFTAACRGGCVATGGSTGTVHLWNLAGERVAQLATGAGIASLRFEGEGEGEGKALLVGTYDGRLLRWDFERLRPLPNPHASRVTSFAFSRDSSCFVVRGREALSCELKTGVTRPAGDLVPLGAGPKGREILAFRTKDRRHVVCDGWTFEVHRTIGDAPPALDFQSGWTLAPDRKTVLIGDAFFDIERGTATEIEHLGSNNDVSWSAKGHAAVEFGIGIDSGSGFRIFGPDRKVVFDKEYPSLAGWPSCGVLTHDFAPSGDFVTYVEWNRDSPSILHRIDTGSGQVVASAGAAVQSYRHVDEAHAIAAMADHSLELFDARDLRRLGRLAPGGDPVRDLLLSPDRRWLVVVHELCVRIHAVGSRVR